MCVFPHWSSSYNVFILMPWSIYLPHCYNNLLLRDPPQLTTILSFCGCTATASLNFVILALGTHYPIPMHKLYDFWFHLCTYIKKIKYICSYSFAHFTYLYHNYMHYCYCQDLHVKLSHGTNHPHVKQITHVTQVVWVLLLLHLCVYL